MESLTTSTVPNSILPLQKRHHDLRWSFDLHTQTYIHTYIHTLRQTDGYTCIQNYIHNLLYSPSPFPLLLGALPLYKENNLRTAYVDHIDPATRWNLWEKRYKYTYFWPFSFWKPSCLSESELSEVFIVERRDRHRFAGTHSGDWREAYYSTRCCE